MGETKAGGLYQDARTGKWVDANGNTVGDQEATSMPEAEPFEAPPVRPTSFESMTIDEAMGYVENGMLTPSRAVEIESLGKQRMTLINRLKRLIHEEANAG